MKNNTRKVWVNPVARSSAQGRHKQYYQTYDKNGMIVNTVSMKKVKEFDTGTTYMFPRDAETNKIYTGLSKLIINPLKGLTADELISTYGVHIDYQPKLADLVTKDQINKQIYLEIKHGEAPGAYSSNARYSIFKLPPTASIKDSLDEGRGKLDSMMLVLYPRPNLFTTDTPRQELSIAMVEALVELDIIAASKDTANPTYHEFYISEDNEEEAEYSRKRDLIEEAMYKLYEIKNRSSFFKQYQFATLLRTKSNQTLVKGDVSPDAVRGALSNYLSDNNKAQMEHARRLIDIHNLQSSPEGADRFHVMYLIQQAVNNNVIIHRDNNYIWPSQANNPDVYQLGTTRDKLISFFLKEMNTPEPKGKKVVVNYYQELLGEVKATGAQFK